MSEPPLVIIEVSIDAEGHLSSRLRPCKLTTQNYGELMGKLIRMIAKMFAGEMGVPERVAYAQILHYLDIEIDQEDGEGSSLPRLQ